MPLPAGPTSVEAGRLATEPSKGCGREVAGRAPAGSQATKGARSRPLGTYHFFCSASQRAPSDLTCSRSLKLALR